MNFQPSLPFVVSIPICLIILAVGTWLCVRSVRQAPSETAKIILAIRVLVLLVICVILLNPGEWRSEESDTRTEWAVMIDTSESMKVEEGGASRIERAQKLLTEIQEHSSEAEVDLRIYPFAKSLRSEVKGEGVTFLADDSHTLLESSSGELLQSLSASGSKLGGVIVVSDGRQTTNVENQSFFMKAQAAQAKFYTYPVGADYPTVDIEVRSPYKLVSAFAGQVVPVSAHVQIKNSDVQVVKLDLLTEAGELVDSTDLDLSSGGSKLHSFSVVAPDTSTSYILKVAELDGEVRLSNNETKVTVRVLQSKTRVFIAEGAPYWDSKFFAQLLRQQKYMDVTAVYRLSSSRWFMIDSENGKPFEMSTKVFPATVEELSKYDLIVLGKNIDGFISPQIASNLKQYVREHGGAVLFARGKAFSSEWPDLEVLEPVSWKSQKHKEFKMRPTLDGEQIGLFGQALPGIDSSVWASLPPLKDASEVDSVKPFTRVLAEGSGTSGEFPLLMVRRYGQGVAGMINADGLWKWDFYPEVKSMGNMYNEFWSQLIQWMVSYSEFLPGYQHSLHLSSSSVRSGEVIALRLGYRGEDSPNDLRVQIESDQLDEPMVIAPAKSISQDGRVEWRTTVSYENSGSYKLKVLSETDGPLPESSFTVETPPGEFDELSADIKYLKHFAEETGGNLINAEHFSEFLSEHLVREEASIENGQIKWYSWWMHWWVAALLTILLGAEWWLRRRNGLL